MMLDHQFTLVNGQPACDYCAAKIKTEMRSAATGASGDSAGGALTGGDANSGGAPLGLAYGFAAALVSAAAYVAVVITTKFEIGFMAVGVGWLIGTAVRRGYGRKVGTGLKIGAVALVYLAMVLAYSGIGIHAVYNAADADSAAYKEMLDHTMSKLNQIGAGAKAGLLLITVLTVAVVFPLVSGLFGVLFLALGMHQAWSTCGAKDENGDTPADPVRVRVGVR